MRKVKLNLEGVDSNPFSVLAAFRLQAIRERWSNQEIDDVLTEAKSGDYDHLLGTILDHCD